STSQSSIAAGISTATPSQSTVIVVVGGCSTSALGALGTGRCPASADPFVDSDAAGGSNVGPGAGALMSDIVWPPVWLDVWRNGSLTGRRPHTPPGQAIGGLLVEAVEAGERDRAPGARRAVVEVRRPEAVEAGAERHLRDVAAAVGGDRGPHDPRVVPPRPGVPPRAQPLALDHHPTRCAAPDPGGHAERAPPALAVGAGRGDVPSGDRQRRRFGPVLHRHEPG